MDIEIFVNKWEPDSGIPIKGTVQIEHGAFEQAGRYWRVAEALTKDGYVCYADDHKGHGQTGLKMEFMGDLGSDGYVGIIKSLKQLNDIIKEENPGIPLFMIGHSWGSMIGQNYIVHHGDSIKGVALSGTAGAFPGLGLLKKVVKRNIKKKGRDAPLKMIDKGFNIMQKIARLPDVQTKFDWLTRDRDIIKEYIDDPLSGFTPPLCFALDALEMMQDSWDKENQKKVPSDLPIYLFDGSKDFGGMAPKSVKSLANTYKKNGIQDVTVKIYENARHEVLNEINRDEIYSDLIKWFDSHL